MASMSETGDPVATGRRVLEAEAEALSEAASRLGEEFSRAVRLLLSTEGKVVLLGIGKSGQIAQKIAATFRSTGTPAVFLHAAEAVHGDLGLFRPGEPVIAVSKSGTTAEILRLAPAIRRMGSPVVGILGNPRSPMAEWADVVLDGSVRREADPLGVAPTSSAVVALALGDALAAALVEKRGFTHSDFLSLHPSGHLGRSLDLVVDAVFHRLGRIAVVKPDTTVKATLFEMTRKPLGAACVVDDSGNLLGIFTDGDLRRGLESDENLLEQQVGSAMTPDPVRTTPDADLRTAAELMESRSSQISVLPVVRTGTKRLVGLLRLHDIYQPTVT